MLSPGRLDFTFGRFGLRDWMLNAQRYDGAGGSQEQGLYLYATEHATTGQPGRRRRRTSLRVVVLVVCQKIEKKGTGQQRQALWDSATAHRALTGLRDGV